MTAAGATQVTFTNCPPFTKCITKIEWTILDYAEDLDLVIPMYNLIECSSNYSKTTGSLWLCSKDEATNFNADIDNYNNFKSFKYKSKLLGNNEADGTNGILKNTANNVSLKCLSNFWRSLQMPLINCKLEWKVERTKYCVSPEAANKNETNNNNNNNNNIFTIKGTKLYVPVVTLSARDYQKLSKLLYKGFERSIYWNEYKTKGEN